MEIKVRAENKQQAEILGKVALYKANSLKQEGNVELPGNVFALAGNNCTLEGIGWFSGKFYIQTSTHSVDSDGGYSTGIEVKRIGMIDPNKQTS